jgi:hypothetical protein
MRLAASSLSLAVVVLISLWIVSPTFGDAKEPNVIPAAQAKDHIGERCTVEMTVKASKNASHRRTYYLDSETDYRDPKNFAVIVSYDDAEKFKPAGIEDLAEHYRGKTIRVTGKVIAEDDQTRIHVTEPEQIKLVESAKP